MAEKKYKRTWRPASKGSEGPKKSMPRKKMDKTGARSYWDSAVKASRGSQKKAAQKSMASRTKKVTGSNTSTRSPKPRPRTKDGTYGLKGEAPGQRRTVARRKVVQRMRDRKNATALNSNIKKQQQPRPY